VVPAGGVERRPGEGPVALDLGRVPRAVQLPHRADHGVGGQGLLAVAAAHLQRPEAVGLRPGGRDDLGPEADVRPQPEGVGAVPEVVEQDVLGGEVQRPVVALGECVAVVVVGVVDPASRIGVLVPRAADVAVLLQDHELDSRLLQPVGGEQAGHARADHRHPEVEVRSHLGLVPARGPPVLAPVGQLLLQERQVLGHLRPADRVLHDPQQHVVRGRRGRDRARVAEADERLRRQLPRLGHLVLAQPALGHGHEQRVGPQVVSQQGEVAGGVGDGGQQRWDLGFGQVGADLVVRRGDRRHTRVEGARPRALRPGDRHVVTSPPVATRARSCGPEAG
jgi:hypothetical protein